MGKLSDNSGKNTHNEIYDTSHRQYWNPPGQVAWKDNLIGFFGIVLSVILVMLFDCFILHPIPAPEGTFDSSRPTFSLSASGCEYADAKILSSNTSHNGQELYLVEQDGEVHLIVFSQSMFFTRKIADDLLITGDFPQNVKVQSGLTTWSMTIDKHMRLTGITSYGVGRAMHITMTMYLVIGFAIALTGSVIWGKIKKIRK